MTSHERLRGPAGGAARQPGRPHSRTAAAALMRLQKGAGNKAVAKAIAKPAPPFIEIEGLGVIKIPAGGIELDKVREQVYPGRGSRDHPGWETVYRTRISPDSISFTLPGGSEQARKIHALNAKLLQQHGPSRVDGVLTLPPMHGVPDVTTAEVFGIMPTKLATTRGGDLEVTLGWDDIKLPSWWHATQQFVRGVKPREDVVLEKPK